MVSIKTLRPAAAARRHFASYERHGFLITRSGGHDTPWTGWNPHGGSFRADTLKGAFMLAREMGE
jgi:hypothetical protein